MFLKDGTLMIDTAGLAKGDSTIITTPQYEYRQY